jgi:hypothetical protein
MSTLPPRNPPSVGDRVKIIVALPVLLVIGLYIVVRGGWEVFSGMAVELWYGP